jgi:hypothetical protein
VGPDGACGSRYRLQACRRVGVMSSRMADGRQRLLSSVHGESRSVHRGFRRIPIQALRRRACKASTLLTWTSFLASRLSTGAVENGDRIALRRLHDRTRESGCLYLHRQRIPIRPRRSHCFTSRSYVAEGIRSSRSPGTSGRRGASFGQSGTSKAGLSRLTHSEVRDYLTNSFGGQKSKSLVTWFSHLRVLLRFLHASGHHGS